MAVRRHQRCSHELIFCAAQVVEKRRQPQLNICCLNRHGDLLFLFPSNLAGPSSEMETSAPQGLKACGAPNVVEDEIDQYLSRQDGKIYRSRDPQL